MSARALTFQIDDPKAPDVAELLARHHALMRAQSPPESCHVKSGDELSGAGAMLFSLRESGELLGIGAMVAVEDDHYELKSMQVRAERRGEGLGRVLVDKVLDHARQSGIQQLSLETGSGPEHVASRAVYAAAGFVDCGPFSDYIGDPLSHYMTLSL